MRSRGVSLIQAGVLLSLSLVLATTGLSAPTDPGPVVQEFAVCTNTASQSAPVIDGGLVAWQDARNGNIDIYGYDLASGAESALAAGPGDQRNPALYGGVLAWQERGQVWGDIRVRELASGYQLSISASAELRLALGDNLVLWDGVDIRGLDLATSSPLLLTQDLYAQSQPRVWGDVAVWTDWRNSDADIYGYDLARGTEFPIVVAPGHQWNPAIGGNILVWEDWRNGNADIYGYNLSTRVEFPISIAPGNQQLPAISANLVVWQDNRQGNPDVYGYDLTTGLSFAIASGQLPEDRPVAWGNIVVWQDRRGGNLDIYGARLLPAIQGRVLSQGRNSSQGTHVSLDGYALSIPPDGGFSFLALAQSSHSLDVSLPGYLGRRLDVPAEPGAVSLPDIVLKGGDVNGDGDIDTSDLALTAQAVNTLSPRRGMPPDINGDGVVDILDLALIGLNLGATE